MIFLKVFHSWISKTREKSGQKRPFRLNMGSILFFEKSKKDEDAPKFDLKKYGFFIKYSFFAFFGNPGFCLC